MTKKIFSSIFVFCAFMYTLIAIKPELLLHVQQNPFFKSWMFFYDYTQQPGEIGTYFANIIMQLFYSNLLGSVVIIFLALSLSFLMYGILTKLKLMNCLVFIIIIPFSLTLCLFHDYHFPLVILLQSVFLYLSWFVMLLFRKNTLLFFFPLYFLSYYIFGSGAAIIFAITCILILLFQSTLKPNVIKSIVILVTAILFPFIAYSFIFNINFSQSFIQFLPEVAVTQKFTASNIIYTFLFLFQILLLLSYFLSRILSINKVEIINNKKLQLYFILILFILMGGLIISASNKHERNIVEADFYNSTENYDNVIAIALSDKTYDFSINLNYNRAIDNTGQFLERFFDYPQLLGVTALEPDKVSTPIYTQLASDYYFDINYISKSQHLAYGILTIEPYNVRAIKRVILTNLILGNYTAAQTFLNVLSLNPLSKNFVDHYSIYTQDTNYILNDPILSEKRRLQPNNFALPLNITDRFYDLILKDSNNIQAVEHLQMCFLLDHNLGAFVKNFNTSVKFYNQIPEVYEQAWLLYIYSTKTYQNVLTRIGDNSKNKFNIFIQTMSENKNDKEAAQGKLFDMSNTYLYYTIYLSPRVTKLKIN